MASTTADIATCTMSQVAHLVFRVPEFASLPHKSGDCLATRPVMAFGKQWHLTIYPHGEWVVRPRGQPAHVSIFLTSDCVKEIRIHFSIILGERGNTQVCNTAQHTFGPTSSAFGWRNFLERQKILEGDDDGGNPGHLDSEGTLLVQVDLQPVLDHKTDGVWFPIPPSAP